MVIDLKVEQVVKVIGVVMAVILGGCSSSEQDADDGTVDFTPLERESSAMAPVSAPEPPVSLDERPEYRKIIEGFRARAVQLFERDDIETRLNQIERVFVGTGKYLQLVAIYQDVVEELGLKNPAAVRLARAYIRLGQRQQARAFLDRLDEARPKDAQVAFLEGFYAISKPNASGEAAGRAVEAWQRALKLEPNFEGPGGMTAETLKQRIAQLEGRANLVQRETGESPGGSERDKRERQQPPAKTTPDEERPAGGEKTAQKSEPSEPSPESPDAKSLPDAGAGPASDQADKATPTPVGVLVMRADAARSKGNLGNADDLYQKVLEREPNHLDARVGMLRLDLQRGTSADKLANRLRGLVEHPELTAREAYSLSLFADSQLDRPKLAETFRERVRQLDADYAEQLGIN